MDPCGGDKLDYATPKNPDSTVPLIRASDSGNQVKRFFVPMTTMQVYDLVGVNVNSNRHRPGQPRTQICRGSLV